MEWPGWAIDPQGIEDAEHPVDSAVLEIGRLTDEAADDRKTAATLSSLVVRFANHNDSTARQFTTAN